VDKNFTYKWVGQTCKRRESGKGSEARRSQDMKSGSPLRVDRSSAGVSMTMPPTWSAPTRAFPPPHTLVTANLMGLPQSNGRPRHFTAPWCLETVAQAINGAGYGGGRH
jgi:hypothetical protein